MSLSERINDTNAAPWVIEEIEKLEAKCDFFQSELNHLRESHYRLQEIKFDLRAERDALSAENAALDQERSRARLEAMKLAAHVERLTGTIEFLLDTGEWSSHTTVSQMAKGDISLAPTASLDRLKAQWQVEGAVLVGALLVDKYESNFPGGEDEILQICDYALRRQAEKGGDL